MGTPLQSPDGLHIAPATPEDAPAIASVHIRSWQAAYDEILPPAYLASLSVPARSNGWREILRKQESTVLVARRGPQVLGFVSHGPCRDKDAPPDQGEIWALYADPSAWGQGVGRPLLYRALEELRAAGSRTVSLWVLGRNRRGRAFYEACGFRCVPGSEKTFDLGGVNVEEVMYSRPSDADGVVPG